MQLFGLEGHQGAAHALHLTQPYASLCVAVVTFCLGMLGSSSDAVRQTPSGLLPTT